MRKHAPILALYLVLVSIPFLYGAWTSPRTWVTGEVVTASVMNTHVRDNLAYLKDSPTFDGSIIISGTAASSPNISNVSSDSIIKAWAYVANSGTPSITDDYNVASLTDNGVGDVTVTFATAMPNATYACSVTPVGTTADKAASVRSQTTGAVRVLTITANNGAALDVDFNVICTGG